MPPNIPREYYPSDTEFDDEDDGGDILGDGWQQQSDAKNRSDVAAVLCRVLVNDDAVATAVLGADTGNDDHGELPASPFHKRNNSSKRKNYDEEEEATRRRRRYIHEMSQLVERDEKELNVDEERLQHALRDAGSHAYGIVGAEVWVLEKGGDDDDDDNDDNNLNHEDAAAAGKLVRLSGGWWRKSSLEQTDELTRLEEDIPEPAMPGVGVEGELWYESFHPRYYDSRESSVSVALSATAGHVWDWLRSSARGGTHQRDDAGAFPEAERHDLQQQEDTLNDEVNEEEERGRESMQKGRRTTSVICDPHEQEKHHQHYQQQQQHNFRLEPIRLPLNMIMNPRRGSGRRHHSNATSNEDEGAKHYHHHHPHHREHHTTNHFHNNPRNHHHYRKLVWRDLHSLYIDPDTAKTSRLSLLLNAGFARATAIPFDIRGKRGIVIYYARRSSTSEANSSSLLNNEANEAYLHAAAELIGLVVAITVERRASVALRNMHLASVSKAFRKNLVTSFRSRSSSYTSLLEEDMANNRKNRWIKDVHTVEEGGADAREDSGNEHDIENSNLFQERHNRMRNYHEEGDGDENERIKRKKTRMGKQCQLFLDHKLRTWCNKCRGGNLQIPPCMPFCQSLWTLTGCFVGLFVLSMFNELAKHYSDEDYYLLIGPFGALMTLQYGLTAAPASQPRNAVLGQAVAGAISLSIATYVPESVLPTWIRLAVGPAIAISLMVKLGIPHPPAGAHSVLYASGKYGWLFYVLVVLGTIISVGPAVCVNNACDKRQYPTFWGYYIGFTGADAGAADASANTGADVSDDCRENKKGNFFRCARNRIDMTLRSSFSFVHHQTTAKIQEVAPPGPEGGKDEAMKENDNSTCNEDDTLAV